MMQFLGMVYSVRLCGMGLNAAGFTDRELGRWQWTGSMMLDTVDINESNLVPGILDLSITQAVMLIMLAFTWAEMGMEILGLTCQVQVHGQI